MKKLAHVIFVAIFALVGGLIGPTVAQAADPVCTITINDSNITAVGTNLGDVICINGNNVIVDALGGDDTVIDNGDNNTVNLGSGNDSLDGSEGNIVDVTGGPGDDTIEGTPGPDIIHGDGDDDMLFGEAGPDTLFGGDGDDEVIGGIALDSIEGGTGLNICDYETGETQTSTCKYDDDAPTASEVSFSTTTVDSGPSSATVNLHLRVKDDIGLSWFVIGCSPNEGSGVWQSYSWQEWNKQLSFVEKNIYHTVPTVGTSKDFTVDLPLAFRRGMKPGPYSCEIDATDTLKNRNRTNIGSITVKRTGSGFDDDEPVISQLKLSAKTVDVSKATVGVKLSYVASDPAGIEYLSVECIGSRQRASTSVMFNPDGSILKLPSSTSLAYTSLKRVTVSTTLTFGEGWKPGNYECFSITRDSLANWSRSKSQIAVVAVKRVGSGFDDAGPVISEFAVNKQSFEVGSAPETIVATFRAKDASGVDAIAIGCTAGSIKKDIPSIRFMVNVRDGLRTSNTLLGAGYTNSGSPQDFTTEYHETIRMGTIPGLYTCYLQGALDTRQNSTIDVSSADAGPIPLGSFVVNRTPSGQPSAPKNVAFTSGGPTKGTLTWETPDGLGSPALYAYSAQYSTDGKVWKNFIGGGASVTNSMDVGGLLGDKDYFIRVRGENGGTKGQSEYVDYMSLNWEVVKIHTAAPVAPPVAATSLGVKASTGFVTLTWKAPADNGGSVVRDYIVEYSKNGSGIWFKVAKGKSNSTTIKIPGLRSKTAYSFRVTAVTNVGQSPTSKLLKVVTK